MLTYKDTYGEYAKAQKEAGLTPSSFEVWLAHEKENEAFEQRLYDAAPEMLKALELCRDVFVALQQSEQENPVAKMVTQLLKKINGE